jgi:hypothetical protein
MLQRTQQDTRLQAVARVISRHGHVATIDGQRGEVRWTSTFSQRMPDGTITHGIDWNVSTDVRQALRQLGY